MTHDLWDDQHSQQVPSVDQVVTSLKLEINRISTLNGRLATWSVVEPFCAFRFSLGFSDEVARTRRWSSSSPIRASVKLKGEIRLGFKRNLCCIYN